MLSSSEESGEEEKKSDAEESTKGDQTTAPWLPHNGVGRKDKSKEKTRKRKERRRTACEDRWQEEDSPISLSDYDNWQGELLYQYRGGMESHEHKW